MQFQDIELSIMQSLHSFQLNVSKQILQEKKDRPVKANAWEKGKRKVCNKGQFRLLEQNCRSIRRVVLETKRNHESNISYLEHDQLKDKLPKKQNKGISKLIVQKTYKPKSLQEELTSYCKSHSELEFSSSTLSQLSTKSKNITVNGDIITGNLGHASIIFQQQLVEGESILEVKVMKAQSLNCVYQPHIRVGICGGEHRLDTPLGYGKSIGFNLLKGSIISESKTQESEILSMFPQIHQGDIITVHMKFSPQYKRPNDQLEWQESMLQILVNGKLISRYNGIKQMKYYPAISLYNGARVELIQCGRMGENFNFSSLY